MVEVYTYALRIIYKDNIYGYSKLHYLRLIYTDKFYGRILMLRFKDKL